jgi:hypothetical protein
LDVKTTQFKHAAFSDQINRVVAEIEVLDSKNGG